LIDEALGSDASTTIKLIH